MSYLICGIGGLMIGIASSPGARFWVCMAGGMLLYVGGIVDGAKP